MPPRIHFVWFAGVLCVASCGMTGVFTSPLAPPPPLPTIQGPEDAHLIDEVRGTLLWRDRGSRMSDDAWNEIKVFDLPSRTARQLELSARVGEISGPDDLGRFVYADYADYPRERLRMHELSTQRDVELLDFDGQRAGQSAFAISPRGGDLLVSCWTQDHPRKDARRKHEVVILNIDSGKRRGLGATELRRASWLPDGVHVAVEAWVPDATAPTDGPRSAAGTKDPGAAEFVRPSVQLMDASTGQLQWIAWGRGPCVCPDGRKLLYYSPDSIELHLRDLQSGADRVIDLPGLLTSARTHQSVGVPRPSGLCYAWLNDRIVLYDAVPTEGEDPGYVPGEGLDGYYPRWTIKAADVETSAFMTFMRSANEPIGSFGMTQGAR